MIIDKDQISKKCCNYIDVNKLFDKTQLNNCLIIGGNNSIKKYYLENYIDNFDGYVIRVNDIPQESFSCYYGQKYNKIIINDIYKKYRKYPPKYNITYISNSIKNEIGSIYKEYTSDYCLTTGTVIILLCISYFKNIEIFGFGEYNSDEDSYKGGHLKSIHNCIYQTDFDSLHKWHDINKEHKIIDKFEDLNIVSRLETKFKEK